MRRQISPGGWRSLILGGLLVCAAARADVITYHNGKVLKGVIEEKPEDPEAVSMVTDTGKIRIPRVRIKSIQVESKAQGFIHLGQQHLAKLNCNDAIRAFERALALEPNNQAAKQALDEAQAKLAEQQRINRSTALSQIDKLGEQSRDLIKKEDFKQAESLLKQADKLVPNDEQRGKLAALISNLYLAWGAEREDKLDSLGAEAKLNLALAANPNNEEVVEKMLALWENKPEKREQIVNIYETILERHPEDRTLRKKLADIYYDMGRIEDAEHHYMQLYKDSEEYKGTELEQRLIGLLGRLHLQFARQKNFDKAIYFYRVLSTITTEVDPTAIIFYQYAKKAQTLKPTDLKGRLELAAFAEQNGLDTEALTLYRQLLKAPESKVAAQAALDRYAAKALAGAVAQFQQGHYLMAAALAQQSTADYPASGAIQEKAVELIAKAQAEEAKDRRARRERAKELVQRGDEFYQEAYGHMNNLFNTWRRNMPVLVSDREQAKKFFGYAITAYQEALRIDPSLGTESESLVNVRMNEARNYLIRLNTPPPSMPGNFGRPIPDTAP